MSLGREADRSHVRPQSPARAKTDAPHSCPHLPAANMPLALTRAEHQHVFACDAACAPRRDPTRWVAPATALRFLSRVRAPWSTGWMGSLDEWTATLADVLAAATKELAKRLREEPLELL